MQIENNRFIRTEGLIAIVDLDKSTISRVTRKFLEKKEKDGLLTVASQGLPKSFLLYDDGQKEQTYLSVFSPEVLRQRAGD